MEEFNALVDSQGHTAVGKRMKFLRDKNLDVEFINPVGDIARENLITCCGTEMSKIIGGMLKYYFYECRGEKAYLPGL